MTQKTLPVTRNWETWGFETIAGLVRASLLPWMILAFVGLMAFDAPGSEREVAVWAIVIPVWIYPLTTAVGGLIATCYKRRGQIRQATFALVAPALLTMTFVGLVIGSVCLLSDASPNPPDFQDVAAALQ